MRRTLRLRRLPLRLRSALAFGLTSLLVSSSLAVLAYALVRDSLLEHRQSVAIREAYRNARLVRTGLREVDRDITQLLSGLQVGFDGQALLRFEGRWFASSVTADRELVPRPLRDGANDGRAGHQVFRLTGRPHIAVGVPIPASDSAYFEVTSLDDVERTLDLLARSLVIAGAAAALVGALLGSTIGRAVLRPLRAAAAVARRIVRGDLASRLESQGDRDLEPLVSSFNDMLDQLQRRIEREARFASDVAHEIRGPLTTFAAATEVVNRRKSELPERAVEAVRVLQEQVSSFNQLVLDLLEISRFDAGAAQLDSREIELERFVRAVLSARDEQQVAVRTDSTAPYLVLGDTRRLHQVLSNLLDNAVRYGGGAVAVELAHGSGTVLLAVDDAGPGVPESERTTVFERFARGSTASGPHAPKGSGLGLALVAEHVTLHGGRAWVEISPRGGSRFVVELPQEP